MLAPALMAISTVRLRKSHSVRVASIEDHCTLSQRLRACVTQSWMRSAISSMVRFGIARCRGDVPIKVWMRGDLACFTASQQRSISLKLARERPQIVAFCACRAISETAAKSPSEAMGNPASMMSTPISSRSWAISSFSAWVIVAPGDCSPSRSVVSKIKTWSVMSAVPELLSWRVPTPERSRRMARSEAA